jgi:serine O-acetyltransferase
MKDAEQEHRLRSLAVHLQPDKEVIISVLNRLQIILFPAHFGRKKQVSDFAVKYELGGLLEEVYSAMTDQITLALLHHPEYTNSTKSERKEVAARLAGDFLDKLPMLRELLKMDLQAAFDGDPAAFNKDEIIFSYPGFYAIMVNRIAHELHLMKVPLIPRIMTEYAHGCTGADIHPGATLGRYFFIDHATGVVIGETTVIGDRVKVYQGVTLGGLSTRAGQGLRNVKRHPTIENDVTIYSGASILGGETVIGEGCIIGGNCFITHSIPPHMRVSFSAPELKLRPDQYAVTDNGEY